ncbi:hypothetical protein C1N76_06475 [Geobacillus thermoleovorans]|uniref:Uncharacterized protein n=1 Tax=Geobacillus thermoleovorans TaxID=33941 RepID=A0A2Z3N5N6_GEOTH|nr:hypothetical protein C1N76_06475 [Geobacillus thermoleovorans]
MYLTFRKKHGSVPSNLTKITKNGNLSFFYIFIMKNFFVKYILWWRSIFYKSYHIFILINSLYYEIFVTIPIYPFAKPCFINCIGFLLFSGK